MEFKEIVRDAYYYDKTGMLLKGDCLDWMGKFPDNSIDMILADLPYGTTKCKWDIIIPFSDLWKQYKRVIKKNGQIVLTCKQPFTSVLVLSNIDWLRESLVWIKHKPSNFGNGKSMHLNYTEDIMVFGEGKGIYNPQRQVRESTRVKEAQKGNSKKWNTVRKNDEVSFGTQYEPKDWKEYDADTKLPMNYLVIPAVVSNSNEKLDHPTQKPIALFEHLIKTYTNEGMLVLDNTAGVSTTAVASKNTNRKWICIEQEEKYCKLSKDRLTKSE